MSLDDDMLAGSIIIVAAAVGGLAFYFADAAEREATAAPQQNECTRELQYAPVKHTPALND